MKPQFKTALVVLGIILGTIIGVSLLYNIFTSWEKGLFSKATNHPFYGGAVPSRVVRDCLQSFLP